MIFMRFPEVIFALSVLIVLAGCVSSNYSPVVERNYYNPWEEDVGFAQVVRVGHMLYLSGITSDKESFDEQLDDVYTTAISILDDYGLDSGAIVKEVVYVTDAKGFKESLPTRKKHFGKGPYPASTLVEVERLFQENWMIEVEIVAVIDGK